MATLTAIRSALSSVIESGLETEVFTYDYIPDVAQVPAVVVYPKESDFSGAFKRGLDTWEFELFVLVPRNAYTSNQEALDAFVNGSGDDSIRQAIYNNPTLGLPDCDAFVKGMTGYGGEFEAAQVPHVGAILKVVVRTDGAS